MSRWMLVLVLAALTGCASFGHGTRRPTHSWLLVPLTAPAPSPAAAPTAGELGVGPVEVAPYLDRASVLRRGADQQLAQSLFDQWAEPLGAGVQRVLVENLRQLAPTRTVRFHPWRQTEVPALQLQLRLLRFEGVPGGAAELAAAWELRSPKDKRVLLRRYTELREPVDGSDTAALVAALNRALDAFSREVAAALPCATQ